MYLDCGFDEYLDASVQRDPFAGGPRAVVRVEEPSEPPPVVLRGLMHTPTWAAALVADEGGRSRIVRVGDRVGAWVVVRIDPHGITVRAAVPEPPVGAAVREVVVPLRAPGRGPVASKGGR
jgi:hypothetical protein